MTTEADTLAQDRWPAPEVAQNVNTEELGDLGLSDTEEDAIVAFMKTLSDGWVPAEDDDDDGKGNGGDLQDFVRSVKGR